MRISSTEKQRRNEDLQQMRQESQMRRRVLKTASTHRVEFLWRSTATCEQSLVQKRKLLNQPQATKEESPKHGLMYEEVCVSSRVLLAFTRLDPEE